MVEGGEGRVLGLTDGDGVLVVCVADFLSKVFRVRALVDDTLGIVDVAVVTCASGILRAGRIREVQEDEARETARVTGLSTNNVRKVAVRVGEDVVYTPEGEVVPVAGEIGVRAEGHGTLLVVDVQKLLQVEDLDTMAGLLTADDDVVLECADLAPLARVDTSRLGQTAEVSELSSRSDLGESGTITLSDDGELTTVIRDPAPRRGTQANSRSQVSVGKEVVEVDLCQVSV